MSSQVREVLLIEDDVNYRRSIKFFFTDDDRYRFIEAVSPADGIEQIAGNPQIRVILLDLTFPGAGDFRDVLKHVMGRGLEYRVMVLTGNDSVLTAEEAEKYSVFNYLPKAESAKNGGQAIRFSVDQAFKDLHRVELERKSRFLLEVQKRINENEPVIETLNFICHAVRTTVEGYTCHIRVYDFNRGDYHLAGFAGPDGTSPAMFEKPKAKGEFFSGRVVANGHWEFFADLQELDEFRKFAEEALREQPPTPATDLYWRTVSSAYIVPIKTGLFGNAVDAVLNVSSQTRGYFGPEKRKLVDEFVTQAAFTVTKDWLDRMRKKIHRDYSQIGDMLDEIGERLNGENAIEDIYGVVTRRLSKLLRPEVVSIFRYQPSTSRVLNVAELGGTVRPENSVESYGPGESLTGWVFQNDQPIHEPDPENPKSLRPADDTRFEFEAPPGYLPHIPSGSLEHYLAVPIRIGGKVQGVLRAMNKKSRYYDHENFRLLERGFSVDCRYIMEITANHLGVAIRHAEWLRDSKRRMELVEMLGEASRLINETHTVADLLDLTAAKMAEVMQAEIGMLFMKEGENRVVLKAAHGMPVIPDAFYELGESLTGRVAQSKDPALIDKPSRNDGKYDAQIREHLEDKDGRRGIVESLMVVPIVAKGTMLGVMKVVNKKVASKRGENARYNKGDLELFRTFAEYVAVAIENTREYELTNSELVIHKRNAALSMLVSAVAHEIRNTSGLIPANVAGLRAQLGPVNEQVSKRLALIERVAAQATDFANELAGFAAAKRGEMKILDINEVLRNAIDDLQDLPKYKNSERVRLEMPLAEEPLRCEIFENPFIQIVRNIVINAFQALEEIRDGRIVVSSSVSGKDAILRFEDNGPGIPSDYQEKIFQPDFTTKPNGNGVGLWLVRTQLEQFGGTIALEGKEEGAQFVVTIPLAGEQPDEATSASSAR